MKATCHECGAPLAAKGRCLDHFHALLLLEQEVAAKPAEVAGGRGEIGHFYAVSSYVLQHPEGMNYTAEALNGARRGLADHLAGRVTLAEQRLRARRAANGATRITRRPGDVVLRWPVETWPLTVLEVVNAGVEGYVERVTHWAQSILRTLDGAGV
jgi:uncharacterized protein DUF5946